MGHTFSLEAQAIWKILVAGLVLGAGLPTLFAVGIRSLAIGQGGEATLHADGVRSGPHPVGRIIAVICFAVVLVAVALGILYIVVTGFGKVLSFEHIYPIITEKKK